MLGEKVEKKKKKKKNVGLMIGADTKEQTSN